MMLHLFDQMDQLFGRSLAAGFFFHSFQDMQIKAVGEIGKSIMEGDQIPTGQGFQLRLSIGIQCFQFQLQYLQITPEGVLILRIPACKTLADILTGDQDPATHRDSVYCEYYEAMPWHTEPEAHATMVYDGRYKLSRYHTSKEGELYDLQSDPDEFKNLWNDPAYAHEKIRMLELLTDRMADTVDPLPLPTDKW